jgi:Ribbon-helix-helix domain
MKRVHLYFPEELVARMKAAKAATGIPMSQILRRAVDDWLRAKSL